MGLESLNESLPEFSAQLVYRNGQLEFRPTFEELKEHYYREISTFITNPLKFIGVGGAGTKTEVFKLMPEMNSKHLKTVYAKAEELFGKLEAVQDEYIHWTALGELDIQAHIEHNFTDVQDWIDNFEMLRQKRKELKKLPDQTNVDCISINLIPFKSGIDALFKQLQDALVDTLEDSIEKDADVVKNFIQKGLDKLSSNPSSVEEIEQMHNDAIELGVEKDGIVKMFEGCERKNKMIKQMKGKGLNLADIEAMCEILRCKTRIIPG
jgi:dynein heavy chain 2